MNFYLFAAQFTSLPPSEDDTMRTRDLRHQTVSYELPPLRRYDAEGDLDASRSRESLQLETTVTTVVSDARVRVTSGRSKVSVSGIQTIRLFGPQGSRS